MAQLTPWKIVIIFGIWQLLVVGTIGTWAVRRYRFPYLPLVPLSMLAYAGAGFLAALAGGHGAITGGLVALVEFALPALFTGFGLQGGWAELTAIERWITIATATVAGGVCGLAGGWVAHWTGG